MKTSDKPRCWWCGNDPVYIRYHDEEWGVPLHDDQRLFEMLILEGFQAGLSWITILKKRENFRKAFKGFDPLAVAKFTKRDVDRLMKNAGIVRNRLKIEGAIVNARKYLDIQREHGTFDQYIWRFTGFRSLRDPKGMSRQLAQATSPESEALSADLKKRGFKFVGSTIMYAHMQATGMVDDHVEGCWKYVAR